MIARHSAKGDRHRKIEAELRRALAELVAREVKDPRVGSVTITAVDVAPDLTTARVFFVPFASLRNPASREDPAQPSVVGRSLLGGSPSRHEVREGLARAAGFLRGEVGRRLGLRRAPRLEFVFDDSFDKAERLSSLIGAAVAGRKPE